MVDFISLWPRSSLTVRECSHNYKKLALINVICKVVFLNFLNFLNFEQSQVRLDFAAQPEEANFRLRSLTDMWQCRREGPVWLG